MSKWITSLLLITLGVVFRFIFWNEPPFSHVHYDEAVPGLMAMDMLEGRFTAFYWGAPYLGSLESLIAALFFKLFSPVTFWLRMSPFVSSLFVMAGMLILSRKMNGNRFPLYTGLFLAVPPLVFNEYSLSPMGGYMQTIALGVWILILFLQALKKSEVSFPFYSLLFTGILAGIGFWTFMMIIPFLCAGGFVFFFCLPSIHRNKALALLSLSFLMGSLPWWIGNIENGWMTFLMKGNLADASVVTDQFFNFVQVSIMLFGRCSEFAHHPWEPLIAALTSLVWIAAFGIFFHCFRNFRKDRQTTYTAAMLFLGLLFFAACFILSQNGREQLSRYGLPLYIFLGVPFLAAFEKLASRKKVLHFPFLLILLSLTLPYNFSFIQKYAHQKNRAEGPEEVFHYLGQQGITKAYAHFTTAQSVTFESRKKIICSDFGGFRNIDFLKKVDAAAQTAIITDKRMELPNPDIFEHQLKTIADGYIRKDLGSYTIFHNFTFSPSAYEDISENLIPEATTASQGFNLLDRHFSTAWTSPPEKKDSVIFNFKNTASPLRLELVSGTDVLSLPQSILVEGALNPGKWFTLADIPEYIPVFQEFRGNVRLLPNGHLDIRFKETPLNQIRITLSGENQWGLSELFIYKKSTLPKPAEKNALSLIRKVNQGEKLFLPPDLIPSIQNTFPGLKTLRLIQDDACYRDTYLFWDYEERILNPFENNGILVESLRLDPLKQFFKKIQIPFSIRESYGWNYLSLPCFPKIEKDKIKMIRLTYPSITHDTSLQQVQLSYPLMPDTPVKTIRIFLRNPDHLKINEFKFSLISKGKILPTTPLCLDQWIWADGFIARKTGFQTDFLFPEPLPADHVQINIPESILPFFTLKKIEAGIDSSSLNPSSLPGSPEWKTFPVNAVFDEKIKINTIAFSSENLSPGGCLMLSFSGECIKKTDLPFYIFMHLVNPKGEILFQKDIQIHSPYRPLLEKKEPLFIEHLIPVPQNLKNTDSLSVIMGIYTPESSRRWKIKTECLQENRALVFRNFHISRPKS